MPGHSEDFALSAAAVQSSNATSNLFLGTAPRSWMVKSGAGAIGVTVQPQPARRYSNPTRKRPEPQRLQTTLPAGPSDESPTIAAATPSHASLDFTRQSRLASSTIEDENARQQDTLHSLERPSTATNKQTADAHQAQAVPALNSVSLDGPIFSDTEMEGMSRVPGSDNPHAVAVQPLAANPNTTSGADAEDNVAAEMVALVGDDVEPLFTSQSPEHILLPDIPPTNASNQNVDLFRPSSTQRASPTSRAALLNTSTRSDFAPIGATPPADGGHSGSRGKRVADARLSEERRTRGRLSADVLELQLQLPTPQDSPVTSNMATLIERFESALGEIEAAPPTIDPTVAIDSRRVEMMRDACRENDRFFLLAHNLYCLWSAGQHGILGQLHFTELHFKGMQVLEQVLGPKQYLTSGVFQVFLTFPQAPEALLQDRSRQFAALLEEVRCFLFHLGTGFFTLRDSALRRKCPPCPAEFKFSLKLPSPALQKALFRSILRQTYNDQAWLPQALSLFSNELDNPDGSAISIAELNAYHGAQLGPIVSRWTHAYAQQLKQYEEAARNAGRTLPPASAQPPISGDQSLNSAQMYIANSPVAGPPDTPVNIPGLPQPSHPAPVAPPQFISRPSDSLLRPGHFFPTSSSPIRFSTQPPHPPNPLQHSSPTVLRSQPLATSWAHSPGNISSNFPGPPQITYSHPHSQVWSQNWNGSNPGQALPNHASKINPGTPEIAPMEPAGLPPSSRPGWRGLTILDERQRDGRTEFRVRWNGTRIPDGSWLPEIQLQNAQEEIAVFRARVVAHNLRRNQQRGLGILSPGEPTAHTQQYIASTNPTFAASTQQQHAQGPQLVSNVAGQQQATTQEAVPSVRYQQYSAMVQSLQAPNLQQRPAMRTPAHSRGSSGTPAMQVPPSAQQLSSPPTSRNVHAPARSDSMRTPVSIPSRPTARPETSLNDSYQMNPPTLPAARAAQSAIPQFEQPQQPAVPQQGLPFFHPDPNFILAQMAVPNPDHFALHQAGLRSPEYRKKIDPDGNESDARYYQYVENIIELPEVITRDSGLIRWNMHIPQQVWSRRTTPLPALGEYLIPQRIVANGNVQFRLKAIVLAEEEGGSRPTLSEFCTQPTRWPKCLSVSINEHHGVDFRRKAHHGADLATDITEMVREGDNEIVIAAIFSPQEAEVKFLMVVEIICIADYQTLLRMPPRIPAADALATIIKSWANSAEDDDEVAIHREMSIDLMDPFTSVIWAIPVRGSECRHPQCFDLEVFLSSRTGRTKDSGMSSPDKWLCPICKSDCRPPMLVVDGFLLGVRRILEEDGQLLTKTKAILVRADGTWEPRLEEASKDEGRSAPASNASNPGTPAPPAPAAPGLTIAPAAPPFIVLDDDDD
ncbi:hypothetical protein A1O7_03775 [Cladophialophora yegresii CBS 114405]|uniref:SP-RING-type domain-containing protein n=1 Tax=Cladophialophora yegresii CBS 114405 TaxID=1182544 RepID=W9WMF7_9EURO|nr:uncharacterized protein A1O7_03775 [Cladophialophora yegresii CBS 114405]EXJ59629.1 hypothetical protein A1O7_03775 [Cladophialophora yegresii CBS 114405]